MKLEIWRHYAKQTARPFANVRLQLYWPFFITGMWGKWEFLLRHEKGSGRGNGARARDHWPPLTNVGNVLIGRDSAALPRPKFQNIPSLQPSWRVVIVRILFTFAVSEDNWYIWFERTEKLVTFWQPKVDNVCNLNIHCALLGALSTLL